MFRKWKWVIIIAAALVVALGVWQLWLKPEVAVPVEESTEEMTPEPSVPYGPDVPAQWSWTDIPWRLTDFTVPRGYWVYFSQWNREFLVIPGTPLPIGAPAPDEEALYAQAVVIFNDAYFDQTSFPTWERFTLTMAEFGCARGTSEEDYVLCDGEPVRRVSGTSAVGPWAGFSLPKRAYASQASIGFAPFVMVRVGDDGLFGILFYAADTTRGEPLMHQMIRSLARTAEVAE